MNPTTSATGTEVWSSASWREQATGWLDEQLAEAGIVRTGALDQVHLRPWATVLRAPTSHGAIWLKAAGPGTAFEAGLYELLDRVAPRYVLRPVAVDVARGWIVLPDGGPPLGAQASGAELVEALLAALPEYAQLQRDISSHADSLVALGLSDMRPAVMPRRFEEALEATRGYVEQRGSAADRSTYRRVVGSGETVLAWCQRLAAARAPASIDHNDLHPWNVLVGEPPGIGPARFYDWGDGVVAHPFASMLVALGYVRSHVVEPGDDRALLRMRDAYLEVFSDVGSHAELVEELELACRVGKIARALTWNRATASTAGERVEESWERAPFACMASLLDDSYLGGA